MLFTSIRYNTGLKGKYLKCKMSQVCSIAETSPL